MTDTPKTDAESWDAQTYAEKHGGTCVPSAFARELEREREAYLKALLEISDLLDGRAKRIPLYEAVMIARMALGQER